MHCNVLEILNNIKTLQSLHYKNICFCYFSEIVKNHLFTYINQESILLNYMIYI